ncbi:MAG: D-inositol-3-phosphate glycosyltransferase [Planctomycetes bacterium]|nr:D-inositol-3-phosphate glycosyltransferase [Planctomycetota bacterium]
MTLRVTALSHHYPLREGDWKAPFVVARVAALARRLDVTVVHAVPWFRGLPADTGGAVPVRRARYVYVPGVGKSFDGRLLARSASAAVRASRPDVIEAQFGYPDGEAAVSLARELGCVSAVVLRGTEQILARERRRGARLAAALREADLVLPVSRTLAALARELGAHEDRVRVVENGIDAAVFRAGDRAAARAAVGAPSDGELLLGIGHFVAAKGYDVLLRAFATVRRARPSARLVLIGAGSEERPLRDLAESLGVAAHVTFPGVQPHERVADWMRAADLFVHASRSEGRPNVVLEAQACGLAAVATDVGGTSEIVADGATGRLVPPDDPGAMASAITDALAMPFDRAAVAAHGGRRTWDDTAAALEAAYADAIRRRAVAAGGR